MPLRGGQRPVKWKRFRKSSGALPCLLFLILEAFAVALLPLVFHMDPVTSDVGAGFYAAPSPAHLLGTDGAARDLLARTLCGGRASLFVGVAAPFLSAAIGLPLGLVAGYYGGVAEAVIMRAADVFLAFPGILLSMILVSVIGPSLGAVIVVIGVMGWPALARLVYGNVLSIRETDYVASAMSVGRSDLQILWHDILPGVVSPALVSISFQAGNAILQESGLSFLGMGIRPPQASWGGIIYAAQDLSILTRMPWVWAPSGILIVLTVVSFHFVGEGLRDALDPHMKL
ncbi:MAG: ABC transporter permease [Oscillospiraceae bacterium]|nr:ABC transporter permease [Oscillospiraceae bacterium]